MKKWLAFWLLFLVLPAFGVYFVRSESFCKADFVEKDGEIYVKISDLAKVGIGYISSKGYHYVVFKNNVLFLKENETVYNFSEKFPPPVVVSGEAYAPLKALKKFFSDWYYYESNGMMFFFEKLPSIQFVKRDGNTLYIKHTGVLLTEMFREEIRNGSLTLVVQPVEGLTPLASGNVDVSLENNSVRINVPLTEGLMPELDLTFGKGEITIKISSLKGLFGKMEIADGVLFERKVEDLGNGEKVIVSYLVMDPDKVALRPVLAKGGIGTLERIDEMVRRNGGLAGINANYFDPNSRLPIGLIVIDGKPYSTMFSRRPVFLITEENEVFIGRITVDVTISLKDTLFLVKGINTIAEGDVLLFTRDFSRPIPERNDRVYILIERNRVKGFGYKQRVEGEEMMVVISKKYELYLSGLNVGDPVRLGFQTDIPVKIKHAVEGGPLLLQNGSPLPDAREEKARYGGNIAYIKAPRTVVATKDKKVWFIVFEGYNHLTRGLTYDELVDFLMKRNFENAMCLDGGSSSTMVVGNNIIVKNVEGVPAVPVGILVWRR